jgi:hypothetical protein
LIFNAADVAVVVVVVVVVDSQYRRKREEQKMIERFDKRFFRTPGTPRKSPLTPDRCALVLIHCVGGTHQHPIHLFKQ